MQYDLLQRWHDIHSASPAEQIRLFRTFAGESLRRYRKGEITVGRLGDCIAPMYDSPVLMRSANGSMLYQTAELMRSGSYESSEELDASVEDLTDLLEREL